MRLKIMVIFDEFHERSLHADVASALCREAQQVLRPDLRIMIMSATLNMPELSALLKAPVVISQGRQYPADIIYTPDADERLLPEFVSRAVMIAAKKKREGDILVFLPGEGDIRQTEEILQSNLPGF